MVDEKRNDDGMVKNAEQLGFRPLVAVNPNQTLNFEPDGQGDIPPEHRLVYLLRPPSKALLEEIQNTELEFKIDDVGGSEHRGQVRSGTTRKLTMLNCVAGWKNLFEEISTPTGPTYRRVGWIDPGTNRGSQTWNDAMAKNYERVPESHVSGIMGFLKERAAIGETVEKKPVISSDG